MTVNKFNVAMLLLVLGAIFPIVVGIVLYVYFILSPGIYLIEHVAFTNLIASGASMLILLFNFYKTKKKILLIFFLFLSMWVGGNDTYILIRNYSQLKNIFPIAIIPFTFHVIGLTILSMDL